MVRSASPSPQGQMAFRVGTDTMNATVSDDTLYFKMLSGVSADEVTEDSFPGITDGRVWSLLPDRNEDNSWHLCVGECTMPVPAASPWGLGLLGGLLGLWGFLGLRRRAVS